MAEHLDSQQEKRVAIRFNTTNVPGEPRQRCRQIATDFAQLMLNRGLSHDDHVHLPADFYSNTSQMLYTLCDFNIRDKVPHVENITTEFWKVTYDGQQSPTERHKEKDHVNDFTRHVEISRFCRRNAFSWVRGLGSQLHILTKPSSRRGASALDPLSSSTPISKVWGRFNVFEDEHGFA
ncbi:hypothetical protein DL95DRAFT_448539 [Leptodontidium sp. 2 PMI_412]|nr:hypothetical protein DL95DRAFT_448539 [Leptodontidium sp. 2 PMI_412]